MGVGWYMRGRSGDGGGVVHEGAEWGWGWGGT